jgi:hypothetical protein
MAPKVVQKRSNSYFIFVFFAVLFSFQVLPRLNQDSPLGDESVDMGDGFYYWKGDVVSDNRHPPFTKGLQALPLRFLGFHSPNSDQFSSYEHRDYYFLFVSNRDRFESAAAVSRFVTYLFGLGIGFVLFLIVRRESAPLVWITMILWAFEPALLAFSGFVMADVPLAFLVLICVWRFQCLLSSFSRLGAVVLGFLTAFAVTTKFSAVILLPIYFILEMTGIAGRKFSAREFLVSIIGRWSWMAGAAGFMMALIYLPGTLCIPGFRCPLLYFWDGFYSLASISENPTYFRGVLEFKNHLAYFPTAFLFKSPLPFLILLALSAFLVMTKQVKISAWQWVTPVICFLSMIPFHQLGIREILFVYPFFILVAARAGEWMWNRRIESAPRTFPILVSGLLMFQVLSVGLSFPSYLSYFNELVPENKKIYWLGDSNLDIGQDTKRMVEAAKERGWTHIKLAAFGTVDPSLYGLKWDYWTQRDLAGPQPGWVYLVNAEFIQLGKSFLPQINPILNGWMFKTPPTGMIGDTWYFFVIPGTPKPDPSPRVYSAPPYDLLAQANN